MSLRRLQIGKLLLEHGLISEDQLDTAIIRQTISGHKLGKVLVELGFIQEDQLLALLSEQLQIPLINLNAYALDLAIVQLLPEPFARRNQCIVLTQKEGIYLVGMVDPQDLLAYDEIEDLLKNSIQVAIVREEELNALFNVIYH